MRKFMRKFMRISIVTIILCSLLLFIKNQYSNFLLINSTYGMPALIMQGQVDNLYLGSSMFRQGLDIQTLDQCTNASNYILAYNGNQPALEYLELKYLLDHNVTIKNLYIDMYIYSAWEMPEISDEKIFIEMNIPGKVQLWNLIRKNPEYNNFQTSWRLWVSSNNELLFTWPFISPIINSQFYNGGSLTQTDHASYEALQQAASPKIETEMNSIQKYYLKELIQLSKEHHINLYFVETPKYETIANDPSYLSAMYQYSQFLSEEHIAYIVSKNTLYQGHLDSAKAYAFDNSETAYYMDGLHLSYSGRIAFTSAFQSKR